MVEIVAEISGNHGGSLGKAKELIAEAARCGCQYAKFQLYCPDDMPDANVRYQELMVPDEWLPELFDAARDRHIGLFASVFSVRAVHELLKYDIPYIKIASPDSTRLPMKTYEAIVAATPPDVGLIISSSFKDAHAMWTVLAASRFGFNSRRMYCPPGHPPDISAGNLLDFAQLGITAFSDHTPDIRVPLAFIRAGAQMIEKHFKIDDDCIDADFSADPDTMMQLCRTANG